LAQLNEVWVSNETRRWALAYDAKLSSSNGVAIDAAVVTAIVAGAVTGVGWLVNQVLTGRADQARRHAQASLAYVERQLEELYGPLAFLLIEGTQTFQDLLDALGRRFVFPPSGTLSPDELKTWIFGSRTRSFLVMTRSSAFS
jgi:hypothetical protein